MWQIILLYYLILYNSFGEEIFLRLFLPWRISGSIMKIIITIPVHYWSHNNDHFYIVYFPTALFMGHWRRPAWFLINMHIKGKYFRNAWFPTVQIRLLYLARSSSFVFFFLIYKYNYVALSDPPFTRARKTALFGPLTKTDTKTN